MERAIRTESAAALMHWFGIGVTLAWRWRKWQGVGGHKATRGSRVLQQETSDKGGAAIQTKEWTAAEREAKRETAKQIGLKYPNRWSKTGWTAEQLALLGTDTDEAIAAKLGRTRSAVRSQRVRAGIPAADGRN